mmetsp:Transcript_3340/g.8398  ORF Transcript_3340/g.8398 Transcript_3340/m.8398 type:complete len:206 (-) Transcript_3340:212-829(-)
MQVHPILQARERHLAFVDFLGLGLGTPLHQHRRELLDLELLDDVLVLIRREAKPDRALEDGLAGQGLQDRGRRLLVGEEDDFRLGRIRGHKTVDVVLGEPQGHVENQSGDLVGDGLGLHLALELERRHRVDRIDPHSGRFLDALLVAENRPVGATDGAHLRHAFQVAGDLVVLIEEGDVGLVVVLEEPQAADRAVAELRDDSVEV